MREVPLYMIATKVVFISHNFFQVVLQKSISTQSRQLIICISNSKGYVDEFVGELTFAEQLY